MMRLYCVVLSQSGRPTPHPVLTTFSAIVRLDSAQPCRDPKASLATKKGRSSHGWWARRGTWPELGSPEPPRRHPCLQITASESLGLRVCSGGCVRTSRRRIRVRAATSG